MSTSDFKRKMHNVQFIMIRSDVQMSYEKIGNWISCIVNLLSSKLSGLQMHGNRNAGCQRNILYINALNNVDRLHYKDHGKLGTFDATVKKYDAV